MSWIHIGYNEFLYLNSHTYEFIYEFRIYTFEFIHMNYILLNSYIHFTYEFTCIWIHIIISYMNSYHGFWIHMYMNSHIYFFYMNSYINSYKLWIHIIFSYMNSYVSSIHIWIRVYQGSRCSGVKLFLCCHGKGRRDLSAEHSMRMIVGYCGLARCQAQKLQQLLSTWQETSLGISEQMKPLQFVGQEAEFKTESILSPCFWQSLPKAMPEDNRRFWLQNQWPSFWDSAGLRLVWLASTNTGHFWLGCSCCNSAVATGSLEEKVLPLLLYWLSLRVKKDLMPCKFQAVTIDSFFFMWDKNSKKLTEFARIHCTAGRKTGF